MDAHDITVSFEWFMGLFGTVTVLLIGLLLRWINSGFKSNEEEHEEIWSELKSGFRDIRHRLDHIILYHKEMPPYDEDGDR